MNSTSVRFNYLLRTYHDPVALSRAISEEYLASNEADRLDMAMAMAWHLAAVLSAKNSAGGAA